MACGGPLGGIDAPAPERAGHASGRLKRTIGVNGQVHTSTSPVTSAIRDSAIGMPDLTPPTPPETDRDGSHGERGGQRRCRLHANATSAFGEAGLASEARLTQRGVLRRQAGIALTAFTGHFRRCGGRICPRRGVGAVWRSADHGEAILARLLHRACRRLHQLRVLALQVALALGVWGKISIQLRDKRLLRHRSKTKHCEHLCECVHRSLRRSSHAVPATLTCLACAAQVQRTGRSRADPAPLARRSGVLRSRAAPRRHGELQTNGMRAARGWRTSDARWEPAF